MSVKALELGLAEFSTYFENEMEEGKDVEWKAGGRVSKANPNKEDDKFWRKNGQKYTKNYYEWRMANPNLEIWIDPTGRPAIELGLEVDLPLDTPLKGFVDRVFRDKVSGELIIVDIKTGATASKDGLQLAVYRLAIKEKFGVDIKYGAYWNARGGQMSDPFDLDQYPPEMVSRWFRDTYKLIKAEVFTPAVGFNCGFCGVSQHCYTQNPAIVRPEFNDDLQLLEVK